MSVDRHPYASFVSRVEKPARYLGGEFGIAQKDWDKAEARVCLAFPDIYDIGMSHLGFKILYKILNDDPRTLAERCFTPWIDMQKELRDRSLPLVSLESARPLCDFDVVGFSLQFELTYTNILAMLDLGRIPLLTADRGEDAPLVIAGGPSATHPEPVADFFDAIVIGDGEESATRVSLTWTTLKKQGVPRAARLEALSRLPGVYVPSLYNTHIEPETGYAVVSGPKAGSGAPMPVERSLVPDLNLYPFPDDGPVGGPEAIFDRMSIEIARGCTEGCRFCQAGMIYRPVRERDPQQIVDTLVSAVKKSGYDEVSLTCLSTADYSCIAPLVQRVTEKLAPEKVSLGVSSLRAYGLDETVLDDMGRVRASGVTFAPEAGSQRMRDVVNKNVTEEQLMVTAERIFSREYTSMKLYFMIGLPTEEEEDVREIARVGGRARQVGKRVKKLYGQGAPAVTCSVSTHVPKPHTPFQWCAMDAPAQVREKQRWLRDEARKSKVDLRTHDSETSWLEGVFARGDRRLNQVLLYAYQHGCRFDSWEDQQRTQVWAESFKACGVDPAQFLGTIPVTARLPWDHISVGLEDGFLLREYRKSLKSRLSIPCGKVAGAFVHPTNLEDAAKDTRKLVCYDCGVACDLTAMRSERIDYLTKLDAKVKRLPIVRELPPPPEKKPDGNYVQGKKKPPQIIQGRGTRYRFRYEKLGSIAFLSHLDLIRALPRTFRRLQLPMFYSQGFHPKPDLIFGPALSLGVLSLAEYVDVKLIADIDPQEYVERLTAASPGGLRFTAGVRLPDGAPALSHVINIARYVIAFPVDAVRDLGGEEVLAAAVSRFLSQESITVMRRMDGIGKKVDVRALVANLDLGSTRARSALLRAGLVGEYLPLEVDVRVTGAGSAKASEVAQAILVGTGSPDLPHMIIRTELFATNDEGLAVSPLTEEAMKPKPKPVREPAVDAAQDLVQDPSRELAQGPALGLDLDALNAPPP
jgi:radical SAM family uncharacterized protein/radical SAM-linked protein